MGISCMKLRDSTETPETITIRTSELMDTNSSNIALYLERLYAGDWEEGKILGQWDGMTEKRMVEIHARKLG